MQQVTSETPEQIAATEQIAQSRQAIEALEPSVAPRELRFEWTDPAGQPIERVYIQAQLGMFPTQEFTTRISEILDSFVQGEMGMKIGDLFRGGLSMPVTMDEGAVNSIVDENMELIKAFFKLLQVLPDLQLDIICLSLGVPRAERAWAKLQLQEPPHRGGLTVEDGFDLLEVFIKQNAPLVKDTVVGKAQSLVKVFRLEVLGQAEEETVVEEVETTEEDLLSSLGGTPSSTSSQDMEASA